MSEENAVKKDFLGMRTKREALGLTLKDVFALTRISTVNLEAIESGDFRNLPVPIYARNFIRTYARALDVDSKPILDSYENYLNAEQSNQTQIPQEEKPETLPEEDLPVKKPGSYKTYIMTVLAVIIAAAVIIVIVSLQSTNQPVAKIAVKQPEIVAPAPPQAVPATPVAPPVAVATNNPGPIQPSLPQPVQQSQSTAEIKTALKQNTPVVEKKEPVAGKKGTDTLVIRAAEETWVRMKIDQQPAFQILLKPGERIEHKGSGFELDIGNAGGISMRFRGKLIENLGSSGQVIHMRLPE